MQTGKSSVPDDTGRALIEEGNQVRGFVASNRSDTLLHLFDFLLQQSIEGRRPKEAEIAGEIFQESSAEPGNQRSRVRVGVYRLRKKLDLYYVDKPGARLTIPQGEYRFTIESPDSSSVGEKAPVAGASFRPRLSRVAWVAMSALLLANTALAGFYLRNTLGSGHPSERSALWKFFDNGKRPTVVAIGDYFMLINKQNHSEHEEIIQDLSIDSADTFYEYTSKTPGIRDNLRNNDLYAVSSDTLGSISRLSSHMKNERLLPVSSSELSPDMLKSSNIVYVGALDALSPLLGDPLSEASQINCGTTCYELIDKPSGRRFRSDSPYLLGDRIVPRRDYGYIASYPGPSGNQVLIVSGTGDAGVTQMVGVVTDTKRLEQLRKQIGGNFRSFEALYQVRTMFNQSYGSSLLIARPINSDRIWDKTKRSK